MNISNKIYSFSFHALLICSIAWISSGCGSQNNETGDSHGADTHTEGSLPCVVVSTTDLKGIVAAIGGDKIELHCFGKGNQDPHGLDILPSFVREMNDADLWVQVGNDIEAAWYPDLVRNAKNPKILEGAEGFMDVAEGVIPMEGMVGNVMGVGHHSGLHGAGNPHYLLDPIEGIRVAEAVSKRLSKLVPSDAENFKQNFEAFRSKLATSLIGEELAQHHDIVTIAEMYRNDTLDAFLAKQSHGQSLKGWLGDLKTFRDINIVGDHDLWPYFCRRIGLGVLGYFEPEPGIPPTTKHLQALMAQMKSQSVKLILSAPYFDKRHSAFVSENTGAKVLPMCHQTEARPGTETYYDMIRHNMETIIQGLKDTQ